MVLIFYCFSAPPNPTELVSISADGEAAKASQYNRKEEWGGETKQILQHDAWGREALQADQLAFILLLN